MRWFVLQDGQKRKQNEAEVAEKRRGGAAPKYRVGDPVQEILKSDFFSSLLQSENAVFSVSSACVEMEKEVHVASTLSRKASTDSHSRRYAVTRPFLPT